MNDAPDRTSLRSDGGAHADVADRMAAAQAAYAQTTRDIADLKRTVAELEVRYRALLHSKTWRAMEPARAVARLLRGKPPPKEFAPIYAGRSMSGRTGSRYPDKVKRIFAAGKAGFHAAAAADLRAICDNPKADKAARAQAERGALLVAAHSGDAQERADALARLGALSAWGKTPRSLIEVRILEVALRRSLGLTVRATPTDRALRDPDLLLLLAADAATLRDRADMIAQAFRISAGVKITVRDGGGGPRIDAPDAPVAPGCEDGPCVFGHRAGLQLRRDAGDQPRCSARAGAILKFSWPTTPRATPPRTSPPPSPQPIPGSG